MTLPEKGDVKSNIVVSVVGSTDGMLGQYAAHVSVCHSVEEVKNILERAMESILQAFCERNGGQVPRRIIIYRAGMNENQFDQVLEQELLAFKESFYSRGYNSDYVKMAVIVCQKRHHSRIVFEEASSGSRYEPGGVKGGDKDYLNPCVGLCVDARSVSADTVSGDNYVGSIVSPNTNEFYLNSHAAILGTSKPCKYTLIYDEIGLKVTCILLSLLFCSQSLPTYSLSRSNF